MLKNAVKQKNIPFFFFHYHKPLDLVCVRACVRVRMSDLGVSVAVLRGEDETWQVAG